MVFSQFQFQAGKREGPIGIPARLRHCWSVYIYTKIQNQYWYVRQFIVNLLIRIQKTNAKIHYTLLFKAGKRARETYLPARLGLWSVYIDTEIQIN